MRRGIDPIDSTDICQGVDPIYAGIDQETTEIQTIPSEHKIQDASNITLSDNALSIPPRSTDNVTAAADNYTGPVLRPRKQTTSKPSVSRPGSLSDLSPPAAQPMDMPRAPAQASSRPQRVRQPPTRYRRASSKPTVIAILAQALVSLAKQSD